MQLHGESACCIGYAKKEVNGKLMIFFYKPGLKIIADHWL